MYISPCFICSIFLNGELAPTKEPSAATPKSPEINPGDIDGKEFLEKLVVEYFLTKDGIALPPLKGDEAAVKEFPTALSQKLTYLDTYAQGEE